MKVVGCARRQERVDDLAKQGTYLGRGIVDMWAKVYSQHSNENVIFGLGIDYRKHEHRDPQDDVAIVRELRKHTKSIFRIDANCAWTAEETIQNAPLLKDLGVEFLEQPLKADDWEGMAKVKAHSALPVIADESCIVESDVEKCGPYFHGINIKLTKCGGLTPARRMIKKGKELGLKIMVGCMTESSVGISAIAQLTPQLDYVDMDGSLLLKHDIARGVQILDDGKVIFPKLPGSGIELL